MIPVNESVDIKSQGRWCVSSNHQHYHHSLKMSKESHSIKKPTSSSSSSPNSPGRSFPSPSPQAPKPRHPVIIYTNSPKIIHSSPQDFMALVQNLTGMSRSDNDNHDNNDDEKKSLEIKNKKTDNDNNVTGRGIGENGTNSLNNYDSKTSLRSSNEDSVQSSTGINTNDYEISSVFGDGHSAKCSTQLSVFLEPQQLSSNTRTSMPPFSTFNSSSAHNITSSTCCDDYFNRDNNFPLK